MKRLMWVMLTMILLLVTAYSRSSPEGVFMDGNRYLGESLSNRQAYVMGLMDGLNTGGKSIVATDGQWYAFADLLPHCLDSGVRTNGQLEAMVTRYLKLHPETWHWPMSAIAPMALQHNCQ